MIDSSFASAYFEEHRQAILDDWFALLRLPTVGADPKRLGDCARAAALLKKKLQKMGFEAEIVVPESGLPVPVVFAERQGLEDAPTVLFYGHYDVQPEDPLDGWNTPPFEPVIKDGRVYARGAQDNKGQVCGFLQGVKALLDAGESLPTLKIVLEGQEESGSESLRLLAPQLAKRLRADVLMVSDTSCSRGTCLRSIGRADWWRAMRARSSAPCNPGTCPRSRSWAAWRRGERAPASAPCSR